MWLIEWIILFMKNVKERNSSIPEYHLFSLFNKVYKVFFNKKIHELF